jgi:predicted mannosyl-3-phosphoglycerate phosphatase (HAD superfamily)
MLLANVATERCPEYQVNLANVTKETLRVKLKVDDFVGRNFDAEKHAAEKTFIRLSKQLNACRYMYLTLGDSNDFPVLEEKATSPNGPPGSERN